MRVWLLRKLFGNCDPGVVKHERFFHQCDMAKNMTVIICYGPLDAHRLEGAKEVLAGKAHARIFPRKKTPNGAYNEAGYIPVRFRTEEK